MHANGAIDIEEVQSVAHNCFGSTGTCGAMFTASTMAAAFEAMGIALLGSSSHPAVHLGLGRIVALYHRAPTSCQNF